MRNLIATPEGAGRVQKARLPVLQDFSLRLLVDQVRIENKPVLFIYVRMLSGRLWDFDTNELLIWLLDETGSGF